jgi:RNA polymerase sigma-70 factor, ECF subfamily
MGVPLSRTRKRDATTAVSARRSNCYPVLVPSGDEEPPARSFDDETLEHLDALFGFARRLTGSAAAAEDLVQETYARALSARSSFERGTNLRAWLFRVLRNIFVDQTRRAKASPFALEHAEPETFAAKEDSLLGDRELERLRGVVVRDIEAALAELSPESRLVVLLDLEGLSEREIAEAVDCAPGTVKSRLHRARAVLRALLGGYAP